MGHIIFVIIFAYILYKFWGLCDKVDEIALELSRMKYSNEETDISRYLI